LGSCITCHNQANGNGGYNPYGTAWRNSGHNFAAVESLDSDGDGFTNKEEIIAGTFPGNPNSSPTPLPTPTPPPGTNWAPVASAGTDQAVNEGVLVTLDGSKSSDADGDILSYLWVQKSGPVVGLADDFTTTPTFTAPFVDPAGGPVILTFELTVSDGSAESFATCSVFVFPANVMPVISVTGMPIGLEPNPGGEILSLTAVNPPAPAPGTALSLVYGLFDFEVAVSNPGDTATVVVHLPGPAPAGSRWFKYRAGAGYYDFSREAISNGLGEGAEFSADRTKVILYIQDNGPHDGDNTDLVVRDPSGLGIMPTGAASTPVYTPAGGNFGGGGGCFISAAMNGTGPIDRAGASVSLEKVFTRSRVHLANFNWLLQNPSSAGIYAFVCFSILLFGIGIGLLLVGRRRSEHL
jgi:hypothetical protein